MPKGSCLCGDITWEFDGPPSHLVNCHCSMCRKASGAGFVTYAVTAAASFRFTTGEDKIAHYQSSAGFNRGHCPRCGSVTPDISGDLAVLPAGSVEGDIDHELDCHMFVANKAPWIEITDTAPQFDAYPPEFGMEAVASESREPETAGAVGGSCLCGTVAYEFDPPGDRMVFCHCSRCRRSRGAAHSAQVFVAADRFRWLRGEDRIGRFKVPDATYYEPSFCRQCGSIAPRIWESGIAMMPAGSLDHDPETRAAAHIYVDSKAPWFTIGDEVPQFAEMPPEWRR